MSTLRSLNLSDRNRALAKAFFALLFFGAWELYGRLGDAQILPPFTEVLAAFVDLIRTGQLTDALLESLQLLLYGYAIAIVVGIALGVWIGRSQTANLTFSPYLTAMYATPDIALVPIFLVWFGFGMTGKVVIVFTAALFPILYNVTAGVRDAPEDLTDVARSFGCSRIRILLQVVLPSAVPFIMAGLRLSIGRAVVGMAVAETYLRLGGLGGLIATYGSRFILDYLIAAILILPLLGMGLTKLLAIIERRVAPWRVV